MGDLIEVIFFETEFSLENKQKNYIVFSVGHFVALGPILYISHFLVFSFLHCCQVRTLVGNFFTTKVSTEIPRKRETKCLFNMGWPFGILCLIVCIQMMYHDYF